MSFTSYRSNQMFRLALALGILFAPLVTLAQPSGRSFTLAPLNRVEFEGLDAARANPYVNLYAKRLDVAKLEVKRQSSIAENERVKWVRMKGLADQGAVPRIQADVQETAWKVAVKKVAIANAKVSKAEALLSIARQRTDAGLDMPVCSAGE